MSVPEPSPFKPTRWRGTVVAAIGSVLLTILAAVAAITAGRGANPSAPVDPSAKIAGNRAYFPFMYFTASNTPLPSPTPTATPLPVTPPASGDWQVVLGYYRSSARLPGLAEDTAWNAGAFAHSRYMVKNDVLSNSESTATPWYTDEGAAAAPNSNLLLSDNINLSTSRRWTSG